MAKNGLATWLGFTSAAVNSCAMDTYKETVRALKKDDVVDVGPRRFRMRVDGCIFIDRRCVIRILNHDNGLSMCTFFKDESNEPFDMQHGWEEYFAEIDATGREL